VCFQIIIMDSNPDRSSDDLILDSLICRDTNTIPIKYIHLTNEQKLFFESSKNIEYEVVILAQKIEILSYNAHHFYFKR
jgi:hypothetical protein